MKKLLIFFIITFLASPLYIFADEEADVELKAEAAEISDEDLAITPTEKGPFRIKDRKFEIGLLYGRIGFANNFLTTSQLFQDRVVIDLDDLGNGFKVNLDLGVTPLFFNYFSSDRQWGFGLAIGIDTIGMLNLSGNMLTFDEAKNDKSDIGGAAFVDFKASSFFHVKKLNTKMKANLSVYSPLMYIDSKKFSYTLDNSSNATAVNLDYIIRVYTPTSMEEGASFSLSPTPGVDIQLGAEYPLAEVLGLKEKISFLDFIVGVDLLNIPLAPSTMRDYMEMKGNIGEGDQISIDNAEDLVNIKDNTYDSEKKKIFRPFKMLVWADWKPFDTVPVSFIPTIGFAINPMYHEHGSLEAGIKSRFNLANLFITELGIGFYDRMWKNNIDFILNFRFFELSLGLGLRSQDFAKSWSGGGFNANFGIKFGR